MSINISISVPTGFALNESGAITSTGGVKINGSEQNVSPFDTSIIEKRLGNIEQSIEDKMNGTETKYINLMNCYERLENSNIIFNSKLLNEMYESKTLHKQHTEQYKIQYNELKEYTNNLENRLKLLEEYIQKIEQHPNQEVKKVEVTVDPEITVDPETVDIVSESDDVPDNITDTPTEIAEEEKEDVVEEIEHIDEEETEEKAEEEEEVEVVEEAEEEEGEEEEEEEEEEGMAVEEFEYKGKPYYRDDDNFVYEMSEEGSFQMLLVYGIQLRRKFAFMLKNNNIK
jgi:hypothetical protein